MYNTPLLAASAPYGTKGFVVMHKGGDGAVFTENQATLAGWGGAGNEIKFQTQVGAMPGDTEGTLGNEGAGNVLKYGATP